MWSADQQRVRQLLAGEADAYGSVQREVHQAFEQVWARLRARYPGLDDHRADLRQSLEVHLLRDGYRVLGTYRGEARLSTWLYAVAMRHVSRDAQRLYTQRIREGGSLDPDARAPDTDPEIRAVRRSERDHVRRVLDGLSDEDRTLVALFYEQGLDASQVSAILGISPAGVRMRKKRLLARLQAQLEEVQA